MKVLVTGATGALARPLISRLRAQGHTVIGTTRHPTNAGGQLTADFSRVPTEAWWLPRLVGVDAVVNTVGIAGEYGTSTFESVHTCAPAALFQACLEAGVHHVVQLSALGADEYATTAFHLSKRAADNVLRALPLASTIVQPSLVYGAGVSSTVLFNRLAILPVHPLPAGGIQPLQPVALGDVVEGLVRLVTFPRGPAAASQTVAFVGPAPLQLRDYLTALRRGLGSPSPARVIAVPMGLAKIFAQWLGRFGTAPLNADMLAMLVRGNTAPVADFARLLGRSPLSALESLEWHEKQAMRRQALLGNTLPLLRASVGALWIWTAAVSLGLYPTAASLDLLARSGVTGATAMAALYAGAVLDLLLGLAVFVCRGQRRRWVWAAQLATMAGYSAILTATQPGLWLHPFGPLAKNVPLAALAIFLWAMEPSRERPWTT